MANSTAASCGTFLLAIALAGCATQGTPTPAPAPEATPQVVLPFAPGFVRETRIVYPLEVDGWRAIDEHIYDDPALGVMVRYTNDDGETRLDVFYYPAGPLLEGPVRTAAEEERRGIALAQTQAGKPAPDMGPLLEFPVRLLPDAAIETGQSATLDGYSLDAVLGSGDRQYNSAMVLVHHALYFIKGRMTQPARRADRTELRQQLEGFMASLVPRVLIVNTGTCARELPIEAWQVDGPPEDAMVTVENGDSLAWVLGDRVVATDPASEQAFLARAVGMALQGRLPPDCMGSDPVEPVVADGMREIRIEYR